MKTFPISYKTRATFTASPRVRRTNTRTWLAESSGFSRLPVFLACATAAGRHWCCRLLKMIGVMLYVNTAANCVQLYTERGFVAQGVREGKLAPASCAGRWLRQPFSSLASSRGYLDGVQKENKANSLSN